MLWLLTLRGGYSRSVTSALAINSLPNGSAGSLRGFLRGLSGVDEVGAQARVASLGTRSIKKDSKSWAIDLAIRMIDLMKMDLDATGIVTISIKGDEVIRPVNP